MAQTGNDATGANRHSFILTLTALTSALIGLALLGGGGWLIALGGSAYYAIAGLAFLATAYLLFRRKASALLLYGLFVLATLGWAVWEVGFDWWRIVPRGGVIFLLGAWLLLPWITRPLGLSRASRAPAFALGGALGIAAIVGIVAMAHEPHGFDGALPDARTPAAPELAAGDDWTSYGGTSAGNRWSTLNQITPDNVNKLQVAWQFRTGDMPRPGDPGETTFEVTPIKVDNSVYFCSPRGWVFSLDAETGKQNWKFDPKSEISSGLQHLTCRGVSYHDGRGEPGAANAECPQRIFLPTADARLIAIDAKTGKVCPSFGKNGQVNLWTGMPQVQPGYYYSTSPPVVTKNFVIVAGNVSDNVNVKVPSGVIRAYDVHSGKLVWNWDPSNPDRTAPIGPNEHYSWSSPNSWTVSSADEKLGMIYIPMGNQGPDQYGADRPATTEKVSASIVALDIATGKVRWVFQTVHHDLWDMDIGGQPSLVDLDLPQGRMPALVASTKTGNLFVLDRRTGKPLFPVTERPVPGGAVKGDWTAKTQPFSAVSLMPQEPVKEADLWGATMFDQLACRIKFRSLRYDGPFTPPSLQGSLVYPGNFGVFDWGGLSIDPVRQTAFTNPNYMAFVDTMVPRAQVPADAKAAGEHGIQMNKGAPYAVILNPFLSALGLPCQAPPWGYVAGVDLRTGKVMWKHKNGTIRDQAPVPVPVKMGVPSLGGSISTAGGVAFLTSTIDYYVRGYDVTTGRTLWEDRLPAGGQATPMTYRSKASGRQFLLVAAGGHGGLGTRRGDYVIAYALPK